MTNFLSNFFKKPSVAPSSSPLDSKDNPEKVNPPQVVSLPASLNTPQAFDAMKALLGNSFDPVILDVGAHCGETAFRFNEVFQRPEIHSFEPFRESHARLAENTNEWENIKAYDFGLSDSNGLKEFHSNPSSATNSILATDKQGPSTWSEGLLETEEVITANFKTLDAFMAESNLPKINILKIDVQGAEHLVLKGAKETIAKRKIDLIYTEIIIQPTYVGQNRLDVALKNFYDAGFDLYNVFNLSLTRDGRLRQLDAIFTVKLT